MVDFTKCRVSASGNIITAKGRLSFCNTLTVPKEDKKGKLKFGTSFIIPPNHNLDILIDAVKKCAEEKWGAGKLPKNLKNPLLKADDHDYEGYDEGWILLRPTSIQKPGIVNAAGANVEDDSEIYPGRWAILSLRPFTYDVDGNRGVSLGLQNVQLLDHDANIAGRTRAEDEFEAVEMPEGSDGKKKSADSVFG